MKNQGIDPNSLEGIALRVAKYLPDETIQQYKQEYWMDLPEVVRRWRHWCLEGGKRQDGKQTKT